MEMESGSVKKLRAESSILRTVVSLGQLATLPALNSMVYTTLMGYGCYMEEAVQINRFIIRRMVKRGLLQTSQKQKSMK